MEFTKKVYSTVMVLLFLCMSVMTAQAQTATVKGTVNSSDGPVIGATVKVKGSTTGVVTDLDGNYTIKVKPGDVLTFSYLGMQTKEVKVGKQSTVNVTLAEDQKLLDAVVVVGYGTMRKSDLTGAVTQVGDKAIEKTVSTSIDQVLQGRAQVCRFRQTPVLLVVLQPSVSVVPTHSTHHHSLSSSSTV